MYAPATSSFEERASHADDSLGRVDGGHAPDPLPQKPTLITLPTQALV